MENRKPNSQNWIRIMDQDLRPSRSHDLRAVIEESNHEENPHNWIRVMDHDFRKPRQQAIRAAREAEKEKLKSIREESRIERLNRLWTKYEHATLLCLNCYDFGHRRPCYEPGIIACSKCYTLNRFTNGCNCTVPNPFSINPSGQVYRMAGDPEKPLFYMDVMIGFRMFEAQISNGQGTSTINHHLAKWLEGLTELVRDDIEHGADHVMVPINHRGETIKILCKIVRYQEHEIILGTDYQMKKGFNSTVDNITLTHKSIVLSHPREIQYVYNLPSKEKLKRFVSSHGGVIRSHRTYKLRNWPPIDEEIIPEDPEQEQGESPMEDYIRIDASSDVEDIKNI